jgi:hypothetical protein
MVEAAEWSKTRQRLSALDGRSAVNNLLGTSRTSVVTADTSKCGIGHQKTTDAARTSIAYLRSPQRFGLSHRKVALTLIIQSNRETVW